MKVKDFYKKKYLIAVYQDDEWLVGLYDNTRDLAKGMGMKLDTAHSAMSRLFRNKQTHLKIDGKRYDVRFIKLSNYDLKLFSERGLI